MGVLVDATWWKFDSPITLVEQAAAPDTPNANQLALYSKDSAGVSTLFFKGDNGTEYNLGLAAAHALLSATHTDSVAASPVLGDLFHANSTPAWTKLAGNTTTTRKFLRQTGTGAVSAAPTWDTLLAADVPGAAVTAASTKITLAGSPSAAALAAFSIDVNQANLDHGSIGGLNDNDHTIYGLLSGTLAQFAATTSAQLFGVISDETGGSGVLVGNASPTFTTKITTPIVIGTSTLNLGTAGGNAVNINPSGSIFDAADFSVNDKDLFINSTLGRIGFGTTTPESAFVVAGGNFRIRTGAVGTATAQFEGSADGNVYMGGLNGHPVKMGDDVDGWVLTLDGARIGIGIAAASGKLHVDQPSTTGAIPVLLLDQADVSEEFIRFVGTAAAATLTQSIVAEADVTTATRAGFAKVYVQDDGNQITDQAYFVPLFTLA